MPKALCRDSRRMYETQKQRYKRRDKITYFAFTWEKKTQIIDSGAFSKYLLYCVQKDTRM